MKQVDGDPILLSRDESNIEVWARFVEGGYLEIWRREGSDILDGSPSWAFSPEELPPLLKMLQQHLPLDALGGI